MLLLVNIKSELPSPGSPSAEDTEEMEWTTDPKVKIEDDSFSGVEASGKFHNTVAQNSTVSRSYFVLKK